MTTEAGYCGAFGVYGQLESISGMLCNGYNVRVCGRVFTFHPTGFKRYLTCPTSSPWLLSPRNAYPWTVHVDMSRDYNIPY